MNYSTKIGTHENEAIHSALQKSFSSKNLYLIGLYILPNYYEEQNNICFYKKWRYMVNFFTVLDWFYHLTLLLFVMTYTQTTWHGVSM